MYVLDDFHSLNIISVTTYRLAFIVKQSQAMQRLI